MYDCIKCGICTGKSKGVYIFPEDLKESQNAVEEIKNDILIKTPLTPLPPDDKKKCDILLENKGKRVARVEVKEIEPTFVYIQKYLPQAGLTPYETLVIDYPKLLSYFAAQDEDGLPFYVVVNLIRKCRNGKKVYANLKDLRSIFDKAGSTRYFKRAAGVGDEGGGITEKYHFSIDREFNNNYDELFNELRKLDNT